MKASNRSYISSGFGYWSLFTVPCFPVGSSVDVYGLLDCIEFKFMVDMFYSGDLHMDSNLFGPRNMISRLTWKFTDWDVFGKEWTIAMDKLLSLSHITDSVRGIYVR
jgi:hypothetical protein